LEFLLFWKKSDTDKYYYAGKLLTLFNFKGEGVKNGDRACASAVIV
jgi:hypothetical protein